MKLKGIKRPEFLSLPPDNAGMTLNEKEALCRHLGVKADQITVIIANDRGDDVRMISSVLSDDDMNSLRLKYGEIFCEKERI